MNETAKVVDNTFVSACLRSIPSVDVISSCAKFYRISTSQEVLEESSRFFGRDEIEACYSKVKVHDLRSDSRFQRTLDYLKRRFPTLNLGELASFLVFLYKYELLGVPCYYVTDDKKMRESIEKLRSDSTFIELSGTNSLKLKFTGTIGLIKRLSEKGAFSDEDIRAMCSDLKDSTFRLTPDLLKTLGCTQ